MKTIQDSRLPHTTSLPDEVSVEAVVNRKIAFLSTGITPDDQEAERRAVAAEQENAARNAVAGLPYSDEPGRGVSSTVGAPPPPPAPNPAESALPGALATPATSDEQAPTP